MTFKFSWLCELLEEIYSKRHIKRATHARVEDPCTRIIERWYKKYTDRISRQGPSAIAFLSSLLPERRTDRSYNIQEKRLSHLFGRALLLGPGRAKILHSWQDRAGHDFPTCVEKVMAECEFDPPSCGQEVTLEEIDAVLCQIAANSPFSNHKIQAKANCLSVDELIQPVIRRLQSREAKWLVRMILKSYSPIELPEKVVMHEFHFMLPELITIQNSFEAVVEILNRPEIQLLPARPNKSYERALEPIILKEIVPLTGVMIRQQPNVKARSIKHCCKLIGKRTMSVEHKYDGEYCQVHVDMSKGKDRIQIFSKSGKDSTMDRKSAHQAIHDGLQLGKDGCCIKRRAILEAELVVWSSARRDCLPFHKLRKHVRHGGRLLGTLLDSPKSSDEQLMLVYYDLLMLDENSLLSEPHCRRRSLLRKVVREIEGRSRVVDRQEIEFHSEDGSSQLKRAFASCIRRKWEGLVLKGSDDPYVPLRGDVVSIKLKKDYVSGLGDVADICIVGGRREAKVEALLNMGSLSWTSFYAGCLLNKDNVQRFREKPEFFILGILDHHSLSRMDIRELNDKGRLVAAPFGNGVSALGVKMGSKNFRPPVDLFTQPFVIEVVSAGYDRPSNSDYYTFRFPRHTASRIKFHDDRSICDTIDFNELQRAALESMSGNPDQDDQNDTRWLQQLLALDSLADRNADPHINKSPSRVSGSCTTGASHSTRPCSNPAPCPILVRTDTAELIINTVDGGPEDHGEQESQVLSATCQPLAYPNSTKRAADFPEGFNTSTHRHKRQKAEVKITETSPTSVQLTNVQASSQSQGPRRLNSRSNRLQPCDLESTQKGAEYGLQKVQARTYALSEMVNFTPQERSSTHTREQLEQGPDSVESPQPRVQTVVDQASNVERTERNRRTPPLMDDGSISPRLQNSEDTSNTKLSATLPISTVEVTTAHDCARPVTEIHKVRRRSKSSYLDDETLIQQKQIAVSESSTCGTPNASEPLTIPAGELANFETDDLRTSLTEVVVLPSVLSRLRKSAGSTARTDTLDLPKSISCIDSFVDKLLAARPASRPLAHRFVALIDAPATSSALSDMESLARQIWRRARNVLQNEVRVASHEMFVLIFDHSALKKDDGENTSAPHDETAFEDWLKRVSLLSDRSSYTDVRLDFEKSFCGTLQVQLSPSADRSDRSTCKIRVDWERDWIEIQKRFFPDVNMGNDA